MNNQRGFSLVELMVVMAVSAILLSVAAPSVWALFRSYRLESGAREVAGALQQARAQAITQNLSARVRFKTGTGGYRLETGESVVMHQLPPRVRFGAVPAQGILFHSRGNAAPAGSVVLWSEDRARKVVVSISGRIRITDP